MLQLHKLVGINKKRKRVGRGGDRGGHSGRGGDGQKCRPGAGSEISASFEGGQMPLSRRIPHRGFNNKNFKTIYSIVNLESLESKFDAGEEVTKETLKAKGLIKRSGFKIKVLGNGELKKRLTVHADAFSDKAVKAIEKVGGKAVVLSKETESGSTAA